MEKKYDWGKRRWLAKINLSIKFDFEISFWLDAEKEEVFIISDYLKNEFNDLSVVEFSTDLENDENLLLEKSYPSSINSFNILSILNKEEFNKKFFVLVSSIDNIIKKI